jgi:hypothetical protein
MHLRTFAEAYANLSALMLRKSDNLLASRCAFSSLTFEGNHKESHWNLNTALRRLGRHKEAVKRVWHKIMIEAGYLSCKGSTPELILTTRIPIHIPVFQLNTCSPIEQKYPEIINVVCVKWGTKYNAEYVNKLYRGVAMHLRVPFTFICYTDNPNGVVDNVKCFPLPLGELNGWWNKAFLFADLNCTKLQKNSQVLYIDLDTVIVGDITEIATYTGHFLIWGTKGLLNEDREGGYNSSVMSWRADWGREIYDGLCQLQRQVSQFVHRFDHWLEMLIPNAPLLQDIFPGHCLEYVGQAQQDIPENCRLVSFPLDPKPHQAVNMCEWVKEKWI